MKSSRIVTGGLVWAVAFGIAGVACDKDEASSGGATAPSASASAAAPKASASAAPSAAPAAGSADGGAATNADGGSAEDEVVHNELLAHHQHHHAGFAGFVLAAVETLGVEPGQQAAIDVIRKEYRAKAKPLHEANKALLDLVADGVAADKFERVKIDKEIEKAGGASKEAQAAMHELLEKLHKTLKPEQRVALVDKVEAHWAAWQEANEKAKEGAKENRHLKRLAKELSLPKDEVEKAKAALESEKAPKKPFDAKEIEAYMKAFTTEFVGDKFEAKKLPTAGPGSPMLIEWGAERMVGFYETITPVLTPEQRKMLSEKLKARAKEHGEGPDSKDKP